MPSALYSNSFFLSPYPLSSTVSNILLCCCCLVIESCLTLFRPHGLQPARLLCPWTGSSVLCPRQKYWSRLPFSSPGDLPDPGIKPTSLALAGGFFTSEPPGKPQYLAYSVYNFNVHIFHFYKFYLVLLKICCQVFIFAYFLESKSNFQFTISLNTVNIFIFQFSSNSLSPLGL